MADFGGPVRARYSGLTEFGARAELVLYVDGSYWIDWPEESGRWTRLRSRLILCPRTGHNLPDSYDWFQWQRLLRHEYGQPPGVAGVYESDFKHNVFDVMARLPPAEKALANLNGIRLVLRLHKNGTFEEHEWIQTLGDDVPMHHIRPGTWSLECAALTLRYTKKNDRPARRLLRRGCRYLYLTGLYDDVRLVRVAVSTLQKSVMRGAPSALPDVSDVVIPAKSGGGDAQSLRRARARTRRHTVAWYKLETFPWPDEVDADTRARVEEAMVNLYRGGRDGRKAEKFLVSLGRLIGGRLINEFKTINDNETFDSRLGCAMASAIDQTLHKIDGWMERHWDEDKYILVNTPPDTVLEFAKRWVVWWKEDYWKDRPMDPWDPMVDTFKFEQGHSVR